MLLGKVYRYRERQGGELGSTGAASVGFELSLHAAPDARVLWTGRFDHTQKALSEDLFGAPRYPGAGWRGVGGGARALGRGCGRGTTGRAAMTAGVRSDPGVDLLGGDACG